MFSTPLKNGLFLVTHCTNGFKTLYHVTASDSFDALDQILTLLNHKLHVV